VRTILLYGAETWKTSQETERRLRGFEGRCLRKILKIRWPRTISHRDVWETTGIGEINNEIKRRRLSWVGHVLRFDSNRHDSPTVDTIRKEEKRTTQRNLEKDGRKRDVWYGKDLGELQRMAHNTAEWRSFVDALYAEQHEED